MRDKTQTSLEMNMYSLEMNVQRQISRSLYCIVCIFSAQYRVMNKAIKL